MVLTIWWGEGWSWHFPRRQSGNGRVILVRHPTRPGGVGCSLSGVAPLGFFTSRSTVYMSAQLRSAEGRLAARCLSSRTPERAAPGSEQLESTSWRHVMTTDVDGDRFAGDCETLSLSFSWGMCYSEVASCQMAD